jgi:hypothetical protein
MKFALKKDKMTKDERCLAILNRQPLDRMGVYGFALGFCTVHCHLTIADAYNNPEKLFRAVNKTTADFGWQDIPLIACASFE